MLRRLMWCSLLAALLLGACARKPDEQRLREAITSMQQAVENNAPRGFMAYVASDFTGNDGSVDHDGLANILRVETLRNEKIGVLLGPIDIQLQDDRATVRVTATLTGGSGVLPERGSVYAITSGWRKVGSEWRCYNAKWDQ